jgi:hypothetical protein
MEDDPSKEELEAAHCWEAEDRVPGRPEMTAFRRGIRLHQARWREAKGYPIGSQPITPRPGKPSRPVGSRIPLDYARKTGVTFLTKAALQAATARTVTGERHQSFDHQRFWADLLWSPTMAVNLFGDMAADRALADRAVHTWWPDAPGTVSEVFFAHSPGRLDRAYLGNLISFDAAFVLDQGDGTLGIVGVHTNYHDRVKRYLPKPDRLPRYREVAKRSKAFAPKAMGTVGTIKGTDLLLMWLGQLLVCSMLQHPSKTWSWGRYVVVHPAGNTDVAEASERYRALLADQSTFDAVTIEGLLESGVLRTKTAYALRRRYLPR